MNKQHEFPDWEQLYKNQQVEPMPWFNPDLDPDLEGTLTRLNLHTGAALDLGTGPGTQVMALAAWGFMEKAPGSLAVFRPQELFLLPHTFLTL